MLRCSDQLLRVLNANARAQATCSLLGTADGLIVWGASVECADASDEASCADRELQRAFYLPNAALLGEVQDPPECKVPGGALSGNVRVGLAGRSPGANS
jgi:hypothetical protein